MTWILAVAAWGAHAWWSSIVLTVGVAALVWVDLAVIVGVFKDEDSLMMVAFTLLLSLVLVSVLTDDSVRFVIHTSLLLGIAPGVSAHALAALTDRFLESDTGYRHFGKKHGWWVLAIPPGFMTTSLLLRWLAPYGGFAANAAAREWVVGFVVIVPAMTAGLRLPFWKSDGWRRRVLLWEDARRFSDGERWNWKLLAPFVSLATLAWMLGPLLWPLPWLAWYWGIPAILAGIPAILRGLVFLWYRAFPMQHPSEAFRRRATEKITRQSRLIAIARNGSPLDVRRAAFARIPDDEQKVLALFAKTDSAYGIRQLAVERITDQQILADIARTNGEHGIRRLAVERITDQQVLVDLAKTASEANMREAAAKRITDQQILGYVAKYDSHPAVRRTAVERVTDSQLLIAIGQHDVSWAPRIAALRMLSRSSETAAREVIVGALNNIPTMQLGPIAAIWMKTSRVGLEAAFVQAEIRFVEHVCQSILSADDVARISAALETLGWDAELQYDLCESCDDGKVVSGYHVEYNTSPIDSRRSDEPDSYYVDDRGPCPQCGGNFVLVTRAIFRKNGETHRIESANDPRPERVKGQTVLAEWGDVKDLKDPHQG